MIIIDGKKYRDELLEKYEKEIKENGLDITLAIILVGSNDASKIYVRNKIQFCEKVGIKVNLYSLDENTSENEVIKLIEKLNTDETITGIILQSPVPNGINFDKCANIILPNKDVDGFTSENVKALYSGSEKIIPCTVKGIIKLLEHYEIKLKGARIVIVGRSEIVGKPLSLALTNRDATCTLCHSKTENLKDFTKDADIVISATGKAKIIKSDMVKNDFIEIDVGINRDNGVLCVDFDFEDVKEKAKFLTPVPGGVGPMTIAMIIDNLIYMKRNEEVNNG